MAKRFTSTLIWDEDWFLDIPKEYKLFWFYLKDKCDHAGLWNPNTKFLNSMLDLNVDLNLALGYFNESKQRVKVVESGKWLLLGFFFFQYGKNLNTKNRVHKSILKTYNLEKIELRSIWGQIEVIQGVKEQEQEQEQDKDNIP